jgi:hypothetical protein
MDNDKKRACECGQCFFLAESGSKYCKHHRNVMENYDRKRGRVEGEAAPAPQAATPDAELDEKCKHGIYLEQCDECDGPTFEGNDFMESQAEAPRPSAPTDKLLALVKASVHLAILRHDLGDDDMDIDAILEDTANAVRGIDTCAEEPIQEWTAVAESRPSAPICGQVDEQIMVANYPKSADEIRRVAESRPSAPNHTEIHDGSCDYCGRVPTIAMATVFCDECAKAAMKWAEPRPSAEEVEKMAREWWNNVGDIYFNRIQDKVEMKMIVDGRTKDVNLYDILAAFYQSMQERITRP